MLLYHVRHSFPVVGFEPYNRLSDHRANEAATVPSTTALALAEYLNNLIFWADDIIVVSLVLKICVRRLGPREQLS